MARMRISGWPSVRKCDDLCGRGLTLMTVMNDDPSQLSDDQSRAVAALIREELARRRISRQRLADQAKISISTLEKALAGRRPFTLATTIRLEEALGVPLRKPHAGVAHVPAAAITLAPGELGYYARPAVSFIEASYLTLRPSFGEPAAIYAYRTEICWDAGTSSLVFRESERLDAEFAQEGRVSMPNQSGYIYLITNRQGPISPGADLPSHHQRRDVRDHDHAARRPRRRADPGVGPDRLCAAQRAARGGVRPHRLRPPLLRALSQVPQAHHRG